MLAVRFDRSERVPITYNSITSNITFFSQTWAIHSAQEPYSVTWAPLDPQWIWFDVWEHDEWVNDVGRTPERNRAEMHLANLGLFQNDVEYWHAWEQVIISAPPFLPSGDPSFTNHIIGQWHTVDPAPTGTVSPFMSHELDDNGAYHFRYRGHPDLGHAGDQHTLWSDANYQYGEGKVYRYVEHYKFSQDGTGIWEVWRRAPGDVSGTLLFSRTDLVLGFPGDTGPYPKLGYYGVAMLNPIKIGYRLLASYGTTDLSALI